MALSLLIILLLIIVLEGISKRTEATLGDNPFAQSLLYVPSERILHWAALGDDAVAADLLWLRSIFYVAANDMEERQEHWMKQHSQQFQEKMKRFKAEICTSDVDILDARKNPILEMMFFWNENSRFAPHLYSILVKVTNLDSLFVTPYYVGSLYLSLAYGRYGEAKRLLDKGVSICQDRWEPVYHRGFLRLFYENDKIGALKDIAEAASKKNAPPFVLDLATGLKAGLTGKDAALAFLKSLYDATDDEDLKRRLEVAMNSLIDVK